MSFKIGILLFALISCRPPGGNQEISVPKNTDDNKIFNHIDLSPFVISGAQNGGFDILVEGQEHHIAGLFRTYNSDLGNSPYVLHYWKKDIESTNSKVIFLSDTTFYKNNSVSHSDKSRNYLKLLKSQTGEMLFFFLNQYNILQVISENNSYVEDLGIRCDLIQVNSDALVCLNNNGENLQLSIIDSNLQVIYFKTYNKTRHNHTDFFFKYDPMGFLIILKSTIGYSNQVNLVKISEDQIQYLRYNISDFGNLSVSQIDNQIFLCFIDQNKTTHVAILDEDYEQGYRHEVISRFTQIQSCSWNPKNNQLYYFSQTNNQSASNYTTYALNTGKHSPIRRFEEIDTLYLSKIQNGNHYFLGAKNSGQDLRLIWPKS